MVLFFWSGVRCLWLSWWWLKGWVVVGWFVVMGRCWFMLLVCWCVK